jgi:hypothetical protein
VPSLGLKDLAILRSIARGLCGGLATAEDIDDIASDALLIQLRRGTAGKRAVIDALRYRYGRPDGGEWTARRWRVTHPLGLIAAQGMAVFDKGPGVVDADDLAEWHARDCPAWVEDALRLIARGCTFSDAAAACGRGYDAFYSQVRR